MVVEILIAGRNLNCLSRKTYLCKQHHEKNNILNGYIFRGSNSASLIFAYCLCSQCGSTHKEDNLL